tara:strand:+ start:5504 stop:5896 length:393 start_codon:yes stop_codon:yes gene_type:complete
MSTPFKLKGSPMARNFGISPLKYDSPGDTVQQSHSDSPSGSDGERRRTKGTARPIDVTGVGGTNSGLPRLEDEKKIDLSKLTAAQLAAVVKRNANSARTYEAPTDSITAVRNELHTRFKLDSEKKSKIEK